MIKRQFFGYWSDNSKCFAVPEEAAIIRQIFADYLDGMSFHGIARKLNASKTPSPAKSIWTPMSVSKIVKNKKYAGTDDHETIISADTIDAVQSEMARRREELESRHTFTGLMKCGYCDAIYVRRGSSYKTPWHRTVWTCHTFNRTKKITCPAKQIPESYLISKMTEVLDIDISDKADLRKNVAAITLKGRKRRLFLQITLKDGRVLKISDRFPRTYNRIEA